MRWSRLKAEIRDLLAPSIEKRVSLGLTHYRSRNGNGLSRAWLMLDEAVAFEANERRGDDASSFGTALHEYLQMPIESALISEKPLHRALALLDRRLGKRRLRAMRLPEGEDPLVLAALELRMSGEEPRPDESESTSETD